jgi:enediyne biosynthesis protein CalE3
VRRASDQATARGVSQGTLLIHQVMLGDSTRLAAYDEALRRAVQPGDVVVDVGAGTLILSVLALRHGASHVYAIEGDPEVAVLARVIAERNDLGGRLTLIQGDARTVELPEMADVVVSEMMGNLGPEEQIADVLATVARHNLKPSGRVVPQRVETRLQAIQFASEGWGVWGDDFWGYSLSAIQDYAPSAAQLHFFTRDPVRLSAPAVVADEMLGRTPAGVCDEVELEIVEPGTLHAIVGYFAATLADGVHLSNLPSYPGCNWAVWVWPLRHSAVEPGMAVRARLQRPPDVRDAAGWRLACGVARAEEAGVSGATCGP